MPICRREPAGLPRRVAVLLVFAVVAFLAGCAEREPRELTPAEIAGPGPVFLLGFDGLDPDLVAKWEGEGLLPNFARLREQGAVGLARSTVPMISPPAWTTISTGTPPGDHGVWSFWVPEEGNPRGRYVDASRRLAKPIWQDLTESGRTVGVVNVPITCPPDSVNGFMIAGFPYPENAPLTWPPDLEAEVVESGWKRDAFLGPPAEGAEEAWLEQKLAVAEARREIGLSLLFDRKPEFSFIVFTTPDRIQHHLWRLHDPEHPLYRDDAPEALKHAIRDIYVWCDGVLGEVVRRLPDGTTLFVVADHGFGPASVGVSKDHFVASLPADLRAGVRAGGALFGGDFYLDDPTPENRDALVQALQVARDPSGSLVTRKVHEPSRIPVSGFAAHLGPDVYAEETEGFLFVPGTAGGALTGPLSPRSFSGWHRSNAYFGAWGRPIVAGPVRDLDLADIPAMAMHILGEDIPRRYIHNIPRRLFPLAYFYERPMSLTGGIVDGLRHPDGTPASGTTVDDAIREQLESIGYLD